MINALPLGEKPRIARTTRLTNASHRPARAKRVDSSKRPPIPIKTTRLEGTAKKPSSFERTKNMSAFPNALISQVCARARSPPFQPHLARTQEADARQGTKSRDDLAARHQISKVLPNC